ASFGAATPRIQRLAVHEYAGIAPPGALDVAASNIADGVTTVDGVTGGSAVTAAISAVSNGLHTLTAVARDAAGNQTISSVVSVIVDNDFTPPTISGVVATAVTISGATITWTTNEASDSQVEYGLTTAYGNSSGLNASLATTHTM